MPDCLIRACRVVSLRPMFNTVSIMPGIESRAPDRQASRRGLLLIAEFGTHDSFDVVQGFENLFLEFGRIFRRWHRNRCKHRSKA